MIWRKLLQAYANTRPIKIISHEGQIILKRYFVFQLPTWSGGLRCYLHHFVGDDPDGLHNHPWRWGLALLLAGWYWDHRRWGIKKVRWVNVVNGDTLHRVTLPHIYQPHAHIKDTLQTSWSLFFHTPRRMDWAFVRDAYSMIDVVQGDLKTPITKHYQEVMGKVPTPFSDWYKTAPTGKEWEKAQQRLSKTNRIRYKDVDGIRIRLPDAD